jgi:AmiR/NasT family two-component response regulator
VASREIIGEAKGIIMERQSCTRDEAFDILRRASQRENRKLRDLAEELVVRVETRKRESRPGH